MILLSTWVVNSYALLVSPVAVLFLAEAETYRDFTGIRVPVRQTFFDSVF